jgi:hypothetical protein
MTLPSGPGAGKPSGSAASLIMNGGRQSAGCAGVDAAGVVARSAGAVEGLAPSSLAGASAATPAARPPGDAGASAALVRCGPCPQPPPATINVHDERTTAIPRAVLMTTC